MKYLLNKEYSLQKPYTINQNQSLHSYRQTPYMD